MCKQCSGSGCVHCKTGQAYCCGDRSWGKGTDVLKHPAVIFQTALWLYSLLICREQLSLSSNGSISDQFWCLVSSCVRPGCCGGWAVNPQRETCFSPPKMCSPSWLLCYSVMVSFISSHTEKYLSMILTTLVSFDSWVWCTLALESVSDMEVQHCPESNGLCSPQIQSLTAVETLHLGAV